MFKSAVKRMKYIQDEIDKADAVLVDIGEKE